MNAKLTKPQQAALDLFTEGAWISDHVLHDVGRVCVNLPDNKWVTTTVSKIKTLIEKGALVASFREITLRDRTIRQKIWVRS